MRYLALVLFALGCSNADGDSDNIDNGGGDSSISGDGSTNPDEGFALDGTTPACVNLECRQVLCEGGTTTTISGIVHDPAGKVPLYNVVVYVPNAKVEPFKDGASCDRCGNISGSPLVSTLTDTKGKFVLANVPTGKDVPLVIQIGKWRRQIVVPEIKACADNPLDAGVLRLPKNKSEGDIPKMAITTGGADPLECLLRKVGVSDSEFDVAGGPGRINLYAGQGYSETIDGGVVAHVAASAFAPTFHGGTAFPDATAFWSDVSKLKQYDILLLACEGQQIDTNKPLATRQGLNQYEAAGGRVFASHWHDQWFNQEAPTLGIATWTDTTPPPPDPSHGTIDTTFPKGQSFKDWLANTSSLNPDQSITIKQPKDNVTAVTPDGGAQQWITMANPTAGGATAVEYLTFNTPIGTPAAQQCGRVVYSDLHVSGGPGDATGDHPGQPFPSGCVTTELSPQEKALEFMLFDLSACVVGDDMDPTVPPIQ